MTTAHETPEPEALPGGDRAEVLAFRLGAAEFGLPVADVREIVRVPPITRIPFPPPSVLGVVSVRGGILPVVDLGELLLGIPSSRTGRLVIVEDEPSQSPVALLVDRVLDLLAPHFDRAEPLPEVVASLPEDTIAGVLSPGGERMVTVLNLPTVLGRVSRRDEERR